jgi:hypothetical protein
MSGPCNRPPEWAGRKSPGLSRGARWPHRGLVMLSVGARRRARTRHGCSSDGSSASWLRPHLHHGPVDAVVVHRQRELSRELHLLERLLLLATGQEQNTGGKGGQADQDKASAAVAGSGPAKTPAAPMLATRDAMNMSYSTYLEKRASCSRLMPLKPPRPAISPPRGSVGARPLQWGTYAAPGGGLAALQSPTGLIRVRNTLTRMERQAQRGRSERCQISVRVTARTKRSNVVKKSLAAANIYVYVLRLGYSSAAGTVHQLGCLWLSP